MSKLILKENEMKSNQEGFIEAMFAVLAGLFVLAIFLSLFFVRFQASQSVVSGIVYNTTNNSLISGNTHFCVRAGIDTYVNQSNQSCYCLPPHSPYIDLINKAAQDKTVKVIITSDKYFAIQSPFTCKNNVTVVKE